MKVERFVLRSNGWVPNNERLPVLVYRAVFATDGDGLADRFETLFGAHRWPPQWRDTVYDYHHYHSTAHEALGVAAGEASLMLGGPDGRMINVAAGDALVLPAGTGHRLIKAGTGFLVVGAYPWGQQWDICRKAPSERMRQRMDALPVPGQDPVQGPQGELTRSWLRRPERRTERRNAQ